MCKKDLINEIAQTTGFTKKDSGLALEAILDTIVEALKEGNEVRLMGFGTFGTKLSAPRVGKNPKTGDVINIPAKNKVYCKMSSVLKKYIAD
jgi:DNA-binding protein HU-beta